MALDLSDRRSRRALADTCSAAAASGRSDQMRSVLLLAAKELRAAGTPSIDIPTPPRPFVFPFEEGREFPALGFAAALASAAVTGMLLYTVGSLIYPHL